MPTNCDNEWFVGPVPVSKAFYGETQVYPCADDPGGGPGDDVFTYSVISNGSSALRQALHIDDGRPVFYTTKSPNYYIYESVNGLPSGAPTAYPIADGAPYTSAGAIQKRPTNSQEMNDILKAHGATQNDLIPLETVTGYELMGDCVDSPFWYPQAVYLPPENTTHAPSMYHYLIRVSNGQALEWRNFTFTGGAGKGYGDFVFISSTPLFGFETRSIAEQIADMSRGVEEGWVSQVDLDETTSFYRKRGLL